MKPIILLLVIFALLSCSERKPNNPVDPQIDISFWTPTNLQITTLSQTSVKLTWTDHSAGEATFNIERKIGTGAYTLAGNTNTTQFTETDLLPNISYQWRVTAFADENASNSSISNTWQMTSAIWAPTNLTTTTQSPISVRLNWQDNCSFEDGFKVERKTESGSFSVIAVVSADSINYTDTNLSTDTQYTYRVNAYAGQSESNYSLTVIWGYISAPIFNPTGGTYTSVQTVSISCATNGADIRYTTNGSIPTTTSTLYSTPIAISSNTHLKAQAYKTGYNPSTIATADYIISSIQTVATPIFNPPGGTYTSTQNVAISCSTGSVKTYYTTDYSDPTQASVVYTSPISISSTTTLKAKCYKTGWNPSAICTAIYTISVTQTVATPTFNPPGGTYPNAQSVTISCSTSGATIRYTTNGIDPTSTSALYSTPIIISNNTTLKAKAFKTGWTPSATATEVYTINIPIPANFVLVAGGTFNNGTSNVTLNSFYIDKYELNQSTYQAVMGTNPSNFPGVTNGPVEQVSWFNAIEYCNKRSINEGLIPCYSYSTYGTNPATWPGGWNTSDSNHTNVACSWTANGYRLPTEAEWEFAARGGNLTNNYTYSGSNTIDGVAWYNSNSGNTTHTVGTKTANELGLFDMSGNVWEWNWDIYGSYPSGAQTNPHGAVSGSDRVRRGGGWDFVAYYCTVSYRINYYATYSYDYIGFRLCRVSP